MVRLLRLRRRPDLPALRRDHCPTPSGCGPATSGSSTTPAVRAPGTCGVATPASGPRRPGSRPAAYAAAFAQVQEALHAGNSYEVNLTYRLDAESDLDPVAAYLRLRELNPAPYAGFLQHDVDGRAGGC